MQMAIVAIYRKEILCVIFLPIFQQTGLNFYTGQLSKAFNSCMQKCANVIFTKIQYFLKMYISQKTLTLTDIAIIDCFDKLLGKMVQKESCAKKFSS